MSVWRAWSARISSWLLFAAVAGAPLPFGSDDPIAVTFWCILLGAALVFAPVRELGASQLCFLTLAGIIIAAYAFVLHEQLSSHPWFAVATPHPIWREAGEALGAPLQSSVSIAPHQVFFELGRPLVTMLALLCGFLIGVECDRARALLKVIGWSGAIYAIYGIAAYLLDPTQLLWREKEAYASVLTGTFVNRNTAAVYFGSCSVIWLLFLTERVRRRFPLGTVFSWRVLDQMLSQTPRSIIVAFSMLFFTLAAMFMTGSRAGVVLSLFSLVLAYTVYLSHDLPRRTGFFGIAATASVVVLVIFQIMGSGVSGRFDLEQLADEGRLETYRSTLRMIADHPWFGTGQGTFALSFPAYRSSDISLWGVWDIAHNTLLEIAADMGVPIACLVAVSWIITFLVLIYGVWRQRRDRLVLIAPLAIGLLAVLHSLIDFSLQIPGYAIVVLALVGAGLAQATHPHVADPDPSDGFPSKEARGDSGSAPKHHQRRRRAINVSSQGLGPGAADV
jgi:O-antigen ligase